MDVAKAAQSPTLSFGFLRVGKEVGKAGKEPTRKDGKPQRDGKTSRSFEMQLFKSENMFCIAEELFDLEAVVVADDDRITGRIKFVGDQVPRVVAVRRLVRNNET